METTKTIKMLPINDTCLSMDSVFLKETEKAVFVEVVNTRIHTFISTWIPKSILTKTETGFNLPSWFLNKNFTNFANGNN